MKKLKIKNKDIQNLLTGKEIEYPKYVTQILNLANQNSQGTRPKVVGQLSDLIQEFEGNNIDEWEKWYKKKHPESIKNASEKVWEMIQKFQEVITEIDRDMVQRWVEELVIIKTYSGLKFQEAILKKLSDELSLTYKLATKDEESKGIDGYIGNKPVSIKPSSYKTKKSLSETIDVTIIYYTKKKDGITIEYDLEKSSEE